jgi:glucose/arabinose dehydrogenase
MTSFMGSKKYVFLVIAAAIVAVFSVPAWRADAFDYLRSVWRWSFPATGNVNDIRTSENVLIEIFADGLKKPRVIAFDSRGRMVVSEIEGGRVTMVQDLDGDGVAESKTTLLNELDNPHGLVFHIDEESGKEYLFIAETRMVNRYEYDIENGTIPLQDPVTIVNLPVGGRHFTRTIAIGPNYRKEPIISGFAPTISQVKLYVSVGSSCDVCDESSWKYAAILESDLDAAYTAEFAGGLRNSVFFTFHPATNEIWATEMGRDNLGDDLPPDEINIIRVADERHEYGARRYGWPFCYGKQVRDTTFNKELKRKDIPSDCAETEPSYIDIPAHSAPLGLAFVPDIGWPKEWGYQLIVALHGSWNKKEGLAGYSIVRYELDTKGRIIMDEQGDPSVKELVSFTDGKNIFGRPVDLKFGPDNALYVSDDHAGVIYRVIPK